MQALPTSSAVLDLQFSPHQRDTFAVATSTGTIELYNLKLGNAPHVDQMQEWRLFPPAVLVLSLAWHPSPQMQTTLAVSLSDGRISILNVHHSLRHPQSFRVHSLEAWTVSWSLSSDSLSYILYSGGDDSRLCSTTITQEDVNSIKSRTASQKDMIDEEKEGDSSKSLHRRVSENEDDDMYSSTNCMTGYDAKSHSAGVTAILPVIVLDGTKVEVLVTGSYDEHIRVLAPRANGKWNNILEYRLGGGVWRLKLLETRAYSLSDKVTRFRLLASCMHAGSRILDLYHRQGMQWSVEVAARFEEHESMNYGSDATILDSTNQRRGNAFTAISTSFYDKKLCVWEIPEMCDPSNRQD